MCLGTAVHRGLPDVESSANHPTVVSHSELHQSQLGQAEAGPVVAVTGAGGQLGQLVVRRLTTQGQFRRVIAVDRELVPLPFGGVEVRRFDLVADVEATASMATDADVIVHLAWVTPTDYNDGANRAMLANVLRAVEVGDADHLVTVSSATVYGAWPNAPLPISEIEPLRPNPGFRYAEVKAEQERMIVHWRRRTGRGVTVLRPAAAVADGQMSWLGEALMNAVALRAGTEDPPVQFLHLDDLAAAVVVSAIERLDGPYNVAPDQWLTGADMRALLGPRPRVRLPVAIAERVEARLARVPRSPRPAGLLPHTMHSFVVANDRMRSTGWRPESQNDEAFVEADQAPPWVALNARQRQYASLGAFGLLIAGTVALFVRLITRRR